MEKVQQVQKPTEADNDGRTFIHWFQPGALKHFLSCFCCSLSRISIYIYHICSLSLLLGELGFGDI